MAAVLTTSMGRERPRLTQPSSMELTPTPMEPTDLTTLPATLVLSPAPATSLSTVSTRERPRLMLRLTQPSSMEPTATPTPTELTPTATDTVWPELLPTQEPPPPSWPGAPRVSARGALRLTQPSSMEPTPTPTVSPLCLTPPTEMDHLVIQLVRVILELPPPSSL